MMNHEDMQDEGQDVAQADNVLESMGVDGDSSEQMAEEPREELPPNIKKRLGQQEKRHRKEMRMMQQQLESLHARVPQQSPNLMPESNTNYQNYGGDGQDETVQRAVATVLRQQEMQIQRQRDAEAQMHVQKQYRNLHESLDNASTEYDDFDDVVRNPDSPFTDAVRDAALLIPNPAQVLYKLGKNPAELSRISNLHPIDVAKEMVKLSVALSTGANKSQASARPTMGQIKTTPVINTGAITDKTPISELRKLMKSGWKR